PICVAAFCDEETGGKLGAGYVTKTLPFAGSMAVFEGYSDRIVTSMAGVLQLKISVRGHASHSGHRSFGRNAISCGGAIVTALEELERSLSKDESLDPLLPRSTINVGTIYGG